MSCQITSASYIVGNMVLLYVERNGLMKAVKRPSLEKYGKEECNQQNDINSWRWMWVRAEIESLKETLWKKGKDEINLKRNEELINKKKKWNKDKRLW